MFEKKRGYTVSGFQISVSQKDIESIRSEIRVLSRIPRGEHILEEDLIYYAMGKLSNEEIARIDRHVGECSQCSADLERLLTANDRWTSERIATIAVMWHYESSGEAATRKARDTKLDRYLHALIFGLHGVLGSPEVGYHLAKKFSNWRRKMQRSRK
jgi:hypothetical protein